jgi:acetylornithine deacetylase/succinyl-diaminopimelate desuccinylase-like protein
MPVNREIDAFSSAAQLAMTSWNEATVPLLMEYGRIPNVTPAYDPEWETHGELDRAAELFADWARCRELSGATIEVVRIEGLSPTILIDVPPTDPEDSGTVLVYGHYDKQPRLSDGATAAVPGSLRSRATTSTAAAWPTTATPCPLPSALVALEAIRSTGWRHARCVVLIEGSEESGSPHLPQVLAALAGRIGHPDLVLTLDSGSPPGDRLWVTTSLRGAVVGTLTVEVLDHGVHCGSAGAIVPSSFRVARLLVDRVEDAATGDLLPP